MQNIKEEDFDEIVAVVLKELPKKDYIYERVYDGVIAYHCGKRLLEFNSEDLIAIRETVKNKIEGKHPPLDINRNKDVPQV